MLSRLKPFQLFWYANLEKTDYILQILNELKTTFSQVIFSFYGAFKRDIWVTFLTFDEFARLN